MAEQIEVIAVGQERYNRLSELVKKTHKEKPNPEDVAALRRLFDEDQDLWPTNGQYGKTHAGASSSDVLSAVGLCSGVRQPSRKGNAGTVRIQRKFLSEAGLYWDRRLTGVQRRFRRASESLARIRKLSRNMPALQFNFATEGGKQLNVVS